MESSTSLSWIVTCVYPVAIFCVSWRLCTCPVILFCSFASEDGLAPHKELASTPEVCDKYLLSLSQAKPSEHCMSGNKHHGFYFYDFKDIAPRSVHDDPRCSMTSSSTRSEQRSLPPRSLKISLFRTSFRSARQ